MLRPETEKLWNYLRTSEALAGFVLIGGTALTLHIQHRLSEDLDFVFLDGTNGVRLPRTRLNALLIDAGAHGFDFARNNDPAAEDEMEIAGMDLLDYQQDFLVNGVKVTFFVPEPELTRVVAPNPGSTVRIATVGELFKTKTLVTAERSKSRDWFDLYVLLKHHGYSIFDYYRAFEEAGQPRKAENGMNRLCLGKPQLDDEGFEKLVANAPSLEEMAAFFREQRDRYEIEKSETEAILSGEKEATTNPHETAS